MMNRTKLVPSLLAAVVLVGVLAELAQAQVFIYGPRVVGPRIAPAVMVPSPYPVVSAYRVPTYVAPVVNPVATYRSYRPVVASPVYAPVGVVTTTRVRPAVVGPGIGGLPNVYIPGQPVRNALRFAVP